PLWEGRGERLGTCDTSVPQARPPPPPSRTRGRKPRWLPFAKASATEPSLAQQRGGLEQPAAEDTMRPTMGRTKAEDYIGAPDRPFTGKEYLESLRDDREVYVYGERVPDVTAHPAFRNAARTIAKLYDALHDPATKDVLTCPTDTGNGGFTHKFFRV